MSRRFTVEEAKAENRSLRGVKHSAHPCAPPNEQQAVCINSILRNGTHGVSGSELVSDGYNLDGDGTCLQNASGSRLADQVAVFPEVEPLQDNDGFTLPHFPQAGSP